MSSARAGRRAKAREPVFVVTCEHGGCRIPRAYAPLFRGHARLLASHRGYDRGALRMARELATALGAVLVASSVSRLLVELNRSPHHPAVFSSIMRRATPAVRRQAYRRHYEPYRRAVERAVRRGVRGGRAVIHVSSHTFAPVLRGRVRRTDVGLLYDPRRSRERTLCTRWQAALRALAPGWRVRRNHPYRGTSDGMTAYLRRRFSDREYAGVELEISQKRVAPTARGWAAARASVIAALEAALASDV